MPPDHYLPEKLGVPLFAARAGIGNFDEDPFYLSQDATGFRGLVDSQLRGAFFVNALYTKDTLIGHSTVLNVKLADKSLLLDSNWNPYIAEAPFSKGPGGRRAPTPRGRWRSGRRADGPGGLRLRQVLQQLRRRSDVGPPGAGGRALPGVRGGGSLRDAGPRQQLRLRDGAAHRLEPIQEITTSATWFIRGQRLKLLADLPIIINDPVFTEANVGSYAATDLPTRRPCSRRPGFRTETPSPGKTSSRPGS